MTTRTLRGAALAVALVISGCATTMRGSFILDEYVSVEHRFSVRFPEGWKDASPSGPFAEEPPYLGRLLSDTTALEAVIGTTPMDGQECSATAVGWLAGVRNLQAEFGSRKESMAATDPITILGGAVRGASPEGGELEGRYVAFCRQSSAFIVAVTGAAELDERQKREVDAVLSSVAAWTVDQGTLPFGTESSGHFTHLIEFPGQTLEKIARWYTQDAKNWRNLVEPLNYGLTRCCVRLRVGRAILIPRALIVREDSMPRPTPRPTRSGASSAPEPEEEEEEEVEEPVAVPTATPSPRATPEPTATIPKVIGPRIIGPVDAGPEPEPTVTHSAPALRGPR